MKEMSRFLIVVSALVVASCGGGGGGGFPSDLENPNTDGDLLAKFDRDSYFPVVENAIWSYSSQNTITLSMNYSDTIQMSNIDASAGTFTIFSTASSGSWIDGFVDQDTIGAFVGFDNGISPPYLTTHWSFAYSPLLYEDSQLVLGLQWQTTFESNGLPVTIYLHITSMDTDIVTPGGVTYEQCIEIQQSISYDSSVTDMRIQTATYYVKQGVGFVEGIRNWSNGNVETIYVTDYNIP